MFKMMNVGKSMNCSNNLEEHKKIKDGSSPHIIIMESMNKLKNDNFTFKTTNKNVSNNRRNGKRKKKCLQDRLGCEECVNQWYLEDGINKAPARM